MPCQTTAGERTFRRLEHSPPLGALGTDERAASGRIDDLLRRGWVGDRGQAAKVVRKVLALDPDCAEAYLMLGERAAETPEQARDAFAGALRAVERRLGSAGVELLAAGALELGETSVYLRALLDLARVEWHLGDADRAVERLEQVLHVEPFDPDYARHFLFNYLLATGAAGRLGRLLDAYGEEGSAHTAYTRALLGFVTEGDTEASRAALGGALAANAFVPEYLAGRRAIPEAVRSNALESASYHGTDREAAHYAAFAEEVWRAVPGALAWLAGAAAPRPRGAWRRG